MNIPKKVLHYILIITFIATALTCFISGHYTLPDLSVIIFWVILAATSESLLIILPNGVGLSVSFAIHLSCIIVGGPLLAIIVSGFTYIFCIYSDEGIKHIFNTPFYKTLFNSTQSIISSGVTSIVYLYSGGSIGEFLLVPTIIYCCFILYTY